MLIECKLKVIFEKRGLKQKFVAEKAEINQATLSLIVSGRSIPTLIVAYKIADVLEMRVEDIWIRK
jgi:putative transcriptional regulator